MGCGHRSYYLHHFKLILMMSIDSVVIFLALVENLVNGGNGFQIHLLNKCRGNNHRTAVITASSITGRVGHWRLLLSMQHLKNNVS